MGDVVAGVFEDGLGAFAIDGDVDIAMDADAEGVAGTSGEEDFGVAGRHARGDLVEAVVETGEGDAGVEIAIGEEGEDLVAWTWEYDDASGGSGEAGEETGAALGEGWLEFEFEENGVCRREDLRGEDLGDADVGDLEGLLHKGEGAAVAKAMAPR